jgi:VIT1/CCC1 family predicted Fe2+/Mn2+ transporter
LGLSKKTKLGYLREGIKQEKRSGIIYNVLGIIGLVAFLVGVFSWAFDLIIMGVALFVFGLVMGFYCNKRKNDLMEQLRKMGYKEKE